MKKFSTQCMDKFKGTGKNGDGKRKGPRKQTLDFLSKFARVYHAEPLIQQKLCGFVLN